MKHADEVRKYCITTYRGPARRRGDKSVVIRSGDVHNALNYKNRYPLVCSAIGSNTFEELAHIKRVSIDGPLNGANTIFKFELV
jgi:5-methylcytosine-specific restriction enzyme B